MPRALKSPEDIQREVQRLLDSNREVQENQVHVGVPLPTPLAALYQGGCNWIMEIFGSAIGHEGAVRSAVEEVKRKWNLRP